MNNYYCPYCNSKYQLPIKSKTGKLICGLCGDPLIKKPFIKVNQVIAIIAVLSLLIPLLFTLIFIIKNQIKSPKRNYQSNVSLLTSFQIKNLLPPTK